MACVMRQAAHVVTIVDDGDGGDDGHDAISA